MSFKSAVLAAFVAGVAAQQASAAVKYNEIVYDAPGADGGQEFVELIGTPGESLTGVTLVVIEGDAGAAGGGGVVEQAVSLDGQVIGSNGLFLIRDSSTILSPAPAAGTTILVHDFTPDIENNTSNHFLVRNFSSSVGTDLDTTDDGVLDSTPWSEVLDSLTMLENSGTEFNYTGTASPAGLTPDYVFRATDGQLIAGVGATAAVAGVGPYTYNDTLKSFDGTSVPLSSLDITTFTPGNVNPSVIPEPASLSLLALGALAMGRRRR